MGWPAPLARREGSPKSRAFSRNLDAACCPGALGTARQSMGNPDEMTNAMKNQHADLGTKFADNDIHVERDEDGVWFVTQGGLPTPLGSFRVQGYAEAFARAVAFSRHVEMVVHEIEGHMTRYKRASLTYPSSFY